MLKKIDLQVKLKIIWVLGQGLFLPMVLWLDDSRTSGHYGQALGLFLLLEGLYLIDALLFLNLFQKRE